MAGAVEAIATDAVLLIVLIGDGEHVSLFGHGLMEGGIEYRNHGGILAEYFLAGLHSGSLRRIVQRAEVTESKDILDNLIGYQSGNLVLLAAVEHAVTNSIDLLHAVDNLAFAGGQHIDQSQESLLMGGEGQILFYLHTICSLVLDAAVHANALAQALSQNALVSHINELILQRGASCVDYQNLHWVIPPTKFCDLG